MTPFEWLRSLGDLPPAVAYIVVPVLVVVALAFSLGEELRGRPRLGRAAAGLLLMGMFLQLVREVSGLLPLWAWAAAAIVLPVLSRLSGRWAIGVIVLWLLALAALIAALVGLAIDVRIVGGLVYASGGAALVMAALGRLLRRRQAANPPPDAVAPPPSSPLIDRLDSADAQEGADKYTRE
jgi:hypothetical protein